MEYLLYRHCIDDSHGHYTVALKDETGKVLFGMDALQKLWSLFESTIIQPEPIEFKAFRF